MVLPWKLKLGQHHVRCRADPEVVCDCVTLLLRHHTFDAACCLSCRS